MLLPPPTDRGFQLRDLCRHSMRGIVPNRHEHAAAFLESDPWAHGDDICELLRHLDVVSIMFEVRLDPRVRSLIPLTVELRCESTSFDKVLLF